MGILIIFNTALILLITAALVGVKKWVRSERARGAILLIAPLVTIAFHYSSFLYHTIFTGNGMAYLADNLNLILPIYPCNVVMWCALAYGLMPRKEGRLARFLSDYVF